MSGESQVSLSARMSILWSKISSCRTAGLSRLSVTVVHDRVLMWDRISLVGDVGPGLREMLPDSMRRSLAMMESCWRDGRSVEVKESLVKRFTGTLSKHLQTDEKGMGW